MSVIFKFKFTFRVSWIFGVCGTSGVPFVDSWCRCVCDRVVCVGERRE